MPVDTLEDRELRALSIFPLPEATLFPNAWLPLYVFEPRYRELVRDALAGSRTLAVARLKPGFEHDYEGRPPVFDVCGAGRIVEHVEHDDGRYHIMLHGLARVRIITELPPAQSYRVVRGAIIDDLPDDAGLCLALVEKIRGLWRALGPKLPEALRDLDELTQGLDAAGAYADRVASVMASDAELGQTLLAEPSPSERLRLLAERLQGLADAVAPPSRRGSSHLN